MNYSIDDLLTEKDAIAYLGQFTKISRAVFKCEVKLGHIAFRTCGKRRKYPVWELDNWRKSTMKHIDFIKGGKRGMPTYRSTRQTGDTSVLENLYAQMFGKKPSVV